MYGVRHHLNEDFPGLDASISDLKQNDQSFARLLSELDHTDKTIYSLEMKNRHPEQRQVGELKKRRMQLKDAIYHRLSGKR